MVQSAPPGKSGLIRIASKARAGGQMLDACAPDGTNRPKAGGEHSPRLSSRQFSTKGDFKRAVIIRAGYRVVQYLGIGGLTFRAVAREAGVPLGSTSYYFKDKEALLVEIVRFARNRVFDHYQILAEEIEAGKSWVHVFAAHVEWATTEDHRALVRDYEMFLYGFDNKELLELSSGWIMCSRPVLRRVLSAEIADAVSYLLEGIFLASAKTGKEFSTGEVAALLRRFA